MKKIIIDVAHVKCLIAALAPFKDDGNSIHFEFGIGGKFRKIEDGEKQGMAKLADNRATLVSKGSQICKVFFAYIKDSSDLVEGEHYAAFNLKAADTLSLLNALESYEMDIELSIEDEGTRVKVSIPGVTEVYLNTIVDEEMEPMLPFQKNVVIAQMELDAKGFQSLVQQGGSLVQSIDADAIANRVVIHFTEKTAEMYSTNRNAVEKAWMEANGSFHPVNLAMKELSAYAETLSGEEKQKLQEKMKAAGKENLAKLAEEYGFDTKSFTISFAYTNFPQLCSVIKGEGTANIFVSPAYCYVTKDSVGACFALAGKANQIVYVINSCNLEKYPYRICIDKAELLKGLSFLETASSLGGESKKEAKLKLSMTQGKLEMSMNTSEVKVHVLSLTEESRDGFKNCVVNPKYIKTIASAQEGANLTLCMAEEAKVPLLVSTGGLECEDATARAIIMRIASEETGYESTDE